LNGKRKLKNERTGRHGNTKTRGKRKGRKLGMKVRWVEVGNGLQHPEIDTSEQVK
jgi:hypothetical protein